MEQFNTEAELPTTEEKESAKTTAAKKLVMMGFEQVHLDAIDQANGLTLEQITNMLEDEKTFPGTKEILEELKSGKTAAKDVIKKLERL
jgi:beta-phosphoglucomutase-like phosphatase (HAD superfamily)